MDNIFIHQLIVPSKVGITNKERAFPQPITISIRFFLSLETAGKSDRINKSIDYDHAIRNIRRLLAHQQFRLIENLAETLSNYFFRQYRKKLKAVEISVSKQIYPDAKSIGVQIYREQSFAE